MAVAKILPFFRKILPVQKRCSRNMQCRDKGSMGD